MMSQRMRGMRGMLGALLLLSAGCGAWRADPLDDLERWPSSHFMLVQASHAGPEKHYQVDMQVWEIGGDGEPALMASPTLYVREDRKGTVTMGTVKEGATGTIEPGMVRDGLHAEVLVSRQDGAPKATVTAVVKERDGVVWTATQTVPVRHRAED